MDINYEKVIKVCKRQLLSFKTFGVNSNIKCTNSETNIEKLIPKLIPVYGHTSRKSGVASTLPKTETTQAFP